MKKNNLIIYLLLLMVFVLIGCSVTTITQIDFLKTPEAVYYHSAGTEVKVIAEIEITYSDGKVQKASLEDASKYGIKVAGEKFNGPGEYVLVVSFGTISASFTYQVFENKDDWKDSLFGDKITRENIEYYTINDSIQLSNIRYALDENFVLGANINLSGQEWLPMGEVTVEKMSEHVVIHNVKKAFSGIFDGGIYDQNGNLTGKYKIENLTIKEFYTPLGGLFAGIEGNPGTSKYAEFKNVEFTNMNITRSSQTYYEGTNYTPGEALAIAAYVKFAKIDNVTVTANNFTARAVSGLAGTVLNSNFTNCDVTIKEANIVATTNAYFFSGGIFTQTGQGSGETIINNCTVSINKITYSGGQNILTDGVYVSLFVGQINYNSTVKIDSITQGYSDGSFEQPFIDGHGHAYNLLYFLDLYKKVTTKDSYKNPTLLANLWVLNNNFYTKINEVETCYFTYSTYLQNLLNPVSE